MAAKVDSWSQDEDTKPLINPNPLLQQYYNSLESKIGYRLFLGDTRHFGYYPLDTWWPFPVRRALRRMEQHLFEFLNVQSGALVLDAGCGAGRVACYMASKGLRVLGIDVVERHVRLAKEYIVAQGYSKTASARLMDYHHLESLPEEAFDGVYTMETLVHSTNPESVLAGFYRLLKPGGRIALHEYDHVRPEDMSKDMPKELIKSYAYINEIAAMPGNDLFDRGVLQTMLEKQGFENVRCEDLSENIRPMIMLFFVVAYIPYLLIRLLGLQRWFINTEAGWTGYSVYKYKLGRYVAFSATKPLSGGKSSGGAVL